MPFQRHEFASEGGIGAMAMLQNQPFGLRGRHSTPRVAYASSIQQPRLRYAGFETTVLTVKMNRERLVVACRIKYMYLI